METHFPSRPLIVGFSLLAVVTLVYDIWYIVQLVSGAKFEHIPFLYPLVIAFCIGLMEWMERIGEQTHEQSVRVQQLARVRAEGRRASASAPENLPVE